MRFDPCDLKRPQADIWPHKRDRSQANAYKLHEYTMYHSGNNTFLVKIKIWPLWLQMTPGWPLTPKKGRDP